MSESQTETHFTEGPHVVKPTMADVVARKGRAPSTWALKKRKEMTFWEFICSLDLCAPEVYMGKTEPQGPPPVHPMWKENARILTIGLLPIYIHFASYKVFPNLTWNPWAAYFFYHFMFIFWTFNMVTHLHRNMVKYGTFDQQNRGRDLISDRQRNHLAGAILLYMIIRTAAPFIMAYDRNELPYFTLLSPVKIGLWMIALDFFFYCYHRACHEVPWLWHIHRAHHGTKHPSPILSLQADDYQEVIEVILVPVLATSVVRLSFWQAWTAITYMVYIEAMGHSGIRAYWGHPILGYVLRPLGCELSIEDHDLHHQRGRGGRNYGKQTRIFDKLFNTITERVETAGI